MNETSTTGSVCEIWAPEGYGFIRTPEGERVFFDRRGVRRDHFHLLFVGTEVAFGLEQGPRGGTARDVRVVRANARRLPLV